MLFAILCLLLALVTLELGARGMERLAPPLDPSVPLPGPKGDCIPDCLPGLAAYPEHPGAPGIRMVYSANRDWWYAVPDNASMQANSLGFRGPELPAQRDPAELRIFTLGDSSVWGHGVADDQVFSSVAAAELSERLGRPVRAVIGAQPGHDVRQSYAVLESVGRKVRPDVLIIGNQWSDMFHGDSPDFFKGPGQQSPFALYRVLHRALGPFLKPRVISWINPHTGLGSPERGLDPRTTLTDYMAYLRRMVELGRLMGATPVFIALPAPIDLDPAGLPYYIREYRESMRFVAGELDVPLVDGPKAFREAGATNAMFYDQVHPSPSGHAILGHAVAELLADITPK